MLVEHNLNDLLLFSPDRVGLKADRPFLSSSTRTPRNQYHKNFGAMSNQGFASECLSGNACIVVSSPTLKIKNGEGHSIAVTTVQCTNSSASLENLVDNAGSDVGIENYNMYDSTATLLCHYIVITYVLFCYSVCLYVKSCFSFLFFYFKC